MADPAQLALPCHLPLRANRQRAWPRHAGTRPATSTLLACIPDGLDVSCAQLDPEHKNRISHRGQAMAALAPHLVALLSQGAPAAEPGEER